MPVIIKDFQVVAEEPLPETSIADTSETGQSQASMSPHPKALMQTLKYIKERLARVHAD